MARSIIELPSDLDGDYEVYLNGVQQAYVDFDVDERVLVFNQPPRKDRISGWRWFLDAWSVGTYRQNDTIDIRYEVDGQPRLAHGLEISLVREGRHGIFPSPPLHVVSSHGRRWPRDRTGERHTDGSAHQPAAHYAAGG
jgi:hypothetical protein